MTDLNYKKYSLENLENWLHDAMSCGEATPQEIYDTIVSVVKDNYYTYKHHASQAYELLSFLQGQKIPIPSGFGEGVIDFTNLGSSDTFTFNVDDTSPYIINSLDIGDYSPEGELNAMCDKAVSKQEREKCREYNLREAEYYDKRAKLDAEQDKVVKWQLPVEVDGLTGDCFIQFPDDLLEAANLKEGDQVEWISLEDGNYELRKVNGTK